MLKGPRGERRSADVVSCAVTVAKIATGEIEDTELKQPAKRQSDIAGGRACAASLKTERRSEVASTAAKARWEGN